MIETYTRTLYSVRCDGCGYRNRAAYDGFVSEEEAVNHALGRGWTFENEAWECLMCKTMPGHVLVPKLEQRWPTWG